jgi:hypothetical protein
MIPEKSDLKFYNFEFFDIFKRILKLVILLIKLDLNSTLEMLWFLQLKIDLLNARLFQILVKIS